ncbi:dienelactone hydrolase family protein [Solimonas terrae]|uniref:Dienelactone hydrolase family protein n=1 Tax=Solimonas terrae TaxID=1396819 RepID=A0A6M2BRM6_9GAMM|nr:dienelactone hydrolase family protein [Solimonas terrae]NGY04994.1 dienelactone hydrolase family protein [Solimonas terrae]
MTPIQIKTADGDCRAWLFRPPTGGPGPGVLMYMDALGIRPAMFEIADQLAGYGYVVLLPDLFWRSGVYEPMDPRTVLGDPVLRQNTLGRLMADNTPARVMADTRAFIDCLHAQPDVTAGGIGVTGYCMGGFMALTAAGTYPDEIAAAASYHGGRLATDDAGSPHRLAAKMKARVYVAGAIEDAGFPDDMKARLEAALRDAGVDHCVETYQARHGWTPRDMPVHDAAATQRHWQTLTALFADTLKSSG